MNQEDNQAYVDAVLTGTGIEQVYVKEWPQVLVSSEIGLIERFTIVRSHIKIKDFYLSQKEAPPQLPRMLSARRAPRRR